MKRKRSLLAAAAAVVAVIAAASVVVVSAANQQAPAASPQSDSVAQVQRRTLSAMISQAGTLTYRARQDGSPYAVINQARGTYTKLPASGQVITQGHVLYRVNDSPVVLLYGATPAYRTLAAGASGPDVAELNADLVALRYLTRAQLNSSPGSFGPATTAAVVKLQAVLGVTQSGSLPLGQVVVEPSGLRVTAVSAQPGGSARVGQTVMQGSSTARQVQVALSASQQTSVAVGDKVSITLPNDATTGGVVSAMGAVASCPSSSGSGGSGASSAAPGTDTCSSANSGNTAPTIAVGVTPSREAATGRWDQAPVQVRITTASVPNALVVPVTALLAEAGGGYAVEVVGAGGRHHLVAVSLGLFDDADGLVQITGSGVRAGQSVVVPST